MLISLLTLLRLFAVYNTCNLYCAVPHPPACLIETIWMVMAQFLWLLLSTKIYSESPLYKILHISEILGGLLVYQILMSLLFLYFGHCIDNWWLTAIPVQHLSATSTGVLSLVLPKQRIIVSQWPCPAFSQPSTWWFPRKVGGKNASLLYCIAVCLLGIDIIELSFIFSRGPHIKQLLQIVLSKELSWPDGKPVSDTHQLAAMRTCFSLSIVTLGTIKLWKPSGK